LLSFCILFPALAGLIRFAKISPVFHPFIYCIWIGVFNECLSILIIKSGHSNAVNFNIYMLVESFFFLWQFKNWKFFENHKHSFSILLGVICFAWLLETVIIFKVTSFSSYFLITYSCMLSLMSINLLSRLILTERGSLLKNPVFIICIAFIIYYTFSVLSEAFWVYGLNESKDFRLNVSNISVFTNLLANLLYTFAIIWMPNKQRFSLPSL